jgi:glycosyltransferase involved in cell wall biosynthesis
MAPAISLVIPCYNEAALLPRLLASVDVARRAFSADPDAVEVIVADNDSTDGTAAVASTSSADHPSRTMTPASAARLSAERAASERSSAAVAFKCRIAET